MTPTKEFNLEIIQNLEQNVLEITTEQEFQWQQLENVKGQIRENRDKIEIEMLCYNEKLRLEMEFNISEDLHFLSLLLDRYETLLKKCKRTKRIYYSNNSNNSNSNNNNSRNSRTLTCRFFGGGFPKSLPWKRILVLDRSTLIK